MQLTSADIGFDRQIKTKDEALQHVVAALAEAGHTQAAYLQGIREHEGQISTCLGSGIAIPHGTPHSRDAVLKTGVKVLACPQGTGQDEEQTAYLIVDITAQGNEHFDILRQLTHALGDDRVPDALTRADTLQVVLEILAGNIPLPADERPQPVPYSNEETIFTLHNPHSLHAHPSAALVKAVKQKRLQIQIENFDTRSAIVDAKNLVRVVSPGTKQGHHLHFIASGDDAQRALKAIGDAFDAGLGEIAAQPQQATQEAVKTKRSWLSRLFS